MDLWSRFNSGPLSGCCRPTIFLCLLMAGCPRPSSDPNATAPDSPLSGMKLRILVVDDPAIATAAGQLRGEWEAQTGSEFQIEQLTTEEFIDGGRPAADAVICPSNWLGPLAERNLAAELPDSAMRHDDPDWAEVFELPKLREASWGGSVRAVSFGSPLMVCYYRADLLEELQRRPPRTWTEYQQLAETLADRDVRGEAADENTPWSGTVEPLGPGWAAVVLLARAAPYAKHRNNYSTLFDIRTMVALVSGEPFVRALEELSAAAKLGPADQLQLDPDTVRAAFWRGECGMALSWPTAAAGAGSSLPIDIGGNIEVGFCELPGSRDVYDVATQSWQRRTEDEDWHVPLLCVAGRLGVVSAEADHPAAALQLLSWLSGRHFSRQVCAASRATTLLRRSHLDDPRRWVEKPVSTAAAAGYGELTARSLMRQQWVFALRIPGRSEYMAALDTAVNAVVKGGESPAEALQQAAAQWDQITERLGVERQKAAYLHSLALE